MEDLIIKLSKIEFISDELNKFIEKNCPDNNGMVFSDLGRFVCKNFYKINKNEKKKIFLIIEEAVSSNNEKKSTIIATMFLEAFINCWMNSGFNEEYRDFFGPNSLLFLDKLDEYYS